MPGFNNFVWALVEFRGLLYAGGDFTALGDGTPMNRLATWDGSRWSAVPVNGTQGIGLPAVFSTVYTLAVCNDTLFVGGFFVTLGDGTSANRIAAFDGATWSVLPSGASNGVDGSVLAITEFKQVIYVGGNFRTLGDGVTVANAIAAWDGTSWSTLRSGTSNGLTSSAFVQSMVVFNDVLVVSGAFTQFGNGVAANRIAAWNGTAWSTLRSGTSNGANNNVAEVAVAQGRLFLTGGFTRVGSGTTAYNYAAAWNGTSFFPLPVGSGGVGLSASASSFGRTLLASADGERVWVGGGFSVLGFGNTAAHSLAVINATDLSLSSVLFGASDLGRICAGERYC
jgi:hypothetical protein